MCRVQRGVLYEHTGKVENYAVGPSAISRRAKGMKKHRFVVEEGDLAAETKPPKPASEPVNSASEAYLTTTRAPLPMNKS